MERLSPPSVPKLKMGKKNPLSKEPFYQYIEGIINEKILVGKFMKQAVERFVKDCDRKDFFFDYKEGMRIIDFARLCNHWKGPKTGTAIDPEPHQYFYWVQKYGWKSKETGLPRFRRSYKQIARKNYKTTEAAVEGLFHMAKGVEESAQVYCGATKEEQAIIVVNDAGRIVKASPSLFPRYKLQIREPWVRRVIYPSRNAFMTPVTKKPHDGPDVSMGIGDECHDWPNADVRNTIESGMGNRIAPMFSAITTAGFDKFSYCYSSLRNSALKILEGSIEDDEQLIFIFELDENDDWNDEKLWIKSNPNLLYSSTQLPYLKSQYKKAVNEGGVMEVNFKTKNLNMWTDAAAVWIRDEIWMRNNHKTELKSLQGLECFGGLYTASTESLNCFVLFFPNFREIAGKKLNAFLCYSWLPEKFVQKSDDHVDYRKWVDDEFIRETPGNSADHRIIARDVVDICSKYDVRVVGFAKTFAQYVAPDLDAEGIPVMEVYQGFNNLAQQTEELKKLATIEAIEHFANPVFRWQIGNTVTHTNHEGEEKPDKSGSGSRIGMVSAALNAMVAKFNYYKDGVMTDFSFESIK